LAKGQRFGFHNLRHSLSTWVLNKGKVDPKTVQGMLRHGDICTTMNLYTQDDQERKAGNARRLPKRSGTWQSYSAVICGLWIVIMGCHTLLNLLECIARTAGARTRDLCRDSTSKAGNSLESGGTDGSFQRPEELLATLIAPLSHPRPLSRKSLPNSEFVLASALAAVEPRAICPESGFLAKWKFSHIEICKYSGRESGPAERHTALISFRQITISCD
jgi:hypothetical protein